MQKSCKKQKADPRHGSGSAVKLFQQAELLHGSLQLRLHCGGGRNERQTAVTGIPAKAVHGHLTGMGLTSANSALISGTALRLHGQALGSLTGEPFGADVMGVLRGYVGQHADHALAAQSQQRHDLVIVAGVDVQAVTAGRCDLGHMADVAAGLLDGVDVRVLRKLSQRGGRRLQPVRLGTLYRMQGICTASAMAV